MVRVLPLLIVLASLGASATSSAQDRQQCISAHTTAQQLMKDGKLREARRQLLLCASGQCPDLLTVDCADWLADVERDLPTVVFALRAQGEERVDVRVLVDGQVVQSQLDGKAVPLDPGEHTVRFEPADGEPLERKFVLSAGEKNREVAVSVAPPGGHPGLRLASYVVGGVGAVVFNIFVGFAVSGQQQFDELETTCKPSCDPASSDEVRTKFLAADVSLGIGLAAMGAGAVLFALSWFIDAAPPSGDTAFAIRF
jgi:hypothetical protein